jgi:glycosyltransferase involved in cell wall biosynthesis
LNRAVRILVECPTLLASVRLGVLEPMKPLELQGKCHIKFKETKDIVKSDIAWCDVFICVRGCEGTTLQIVKAVKEAGRYIIYYLDDDLLNVPEYALSYSYYSDKRIQKNLIRILGFSHILWVSNRLIGEKYGKFCNNNWVQNHVPVVMDDEFKIKDDNSIRILYAGSIDHTPVVRQYISPIVRKLCSEFGEKISFTFIGVNPDINDLDNVEIINFFESYEKYKTFVFEGEFHIGLAPIMLSEFHKCKYYNKFIEYTSINAVGVYTNSEPYALVVKDNINGFLCNNTIDEWYSAVKKAIVDVSLRNFCLINARKLIKEEFKPSQIAERLQRDIPEIINFYAPEVSCKEIKLTNMKISFYQNRFKGIWKRYGLLAIPIAMFKAIKITFRKIY